MLHPQTPPQAQTVVLVIEQSEQIAKFLKKLMGEHENIVKFVDANVLKENDGTYILILSELCSQGTLFDLLQKGLLHMHQQSPAIAHRDIKIENVLLNNKRFKLCDFGSASTSVLDYSVMNDQHMIDETIEEFEKYTTMMYRPPEMIDKYKKFLVNTQADVWMLGCVAYTLCFFQHPFQESQKLGIINAHYFMPADSRISNKLKDFVRLMLRDAQEIKLRSENQPDTSKVTNNTQNQFKSQKSIDRDLTADDIQKIQEKLRLEHQNSLNKKKQHVPLPSAYSNISNQQQIQQPIIDKSKSHVVTSSIYQLDQQLQQPPQQKQQNAAGNGDFFNWGNSNGNTQQVRPQQQQIPLKSQSIVQNQSNDWFFDFNNQQSNSNNNRPVQNTSQIQIQKQSSIQTANLLELDSQPLIQKQTDLLSELSSLDFGFSASTQQTQSQQFNQQQQPQQQKANDFFSF
ncbi:UNKNOWN [Stylonychia lemnae]|uniref:non-specific serine/threonine protein kinase n=1 Tax=Stylonychia lemnae TaxID=5949 RepID=A0A078AKM2_STYLE|nr:UNKNOWN [Stylonychia lemnae]|eukprot:CDW82759.1 UNKNOWN [Stylonychia lemnae]